MDEEYSLIGETVKCVFLNNNSEIPFLTLHTESGKIFKIYPQGPVNDLDSLKVEVSQ